jgi:hypothetical protein
MDPFNKSTDPNIIRSVIARIRKWQPNWNELFRHHLSNELLADRAVADLRQVEPVYLNHECLYTTEDPELNTSEVLFWLFHWYGIQKFFEIEGAWIVHRDDWGTLYQIGEAALDIDPEKEFLTKAVEVIDATPQPDGSFKNYWLTVPPHISTAREAVAWTFGIEDELAYCPNLQT